MNRYPMLDLLARWGQPMARGIAGVIAAGSIGVAVSSGNLLWGLSGLALAAIAYVLLASYVELVKLVMDMLLPKP